MPAVKLLKNSVKLLKRIRDEEATKNIIDQLFHCIIYRLARDRSNIDIILRYTDEQRIE